jgi:hypothetical protein
VFGVPKGGGSPAQVIGLACDQYGHSAVSALAFDAAQVYIGTIFGQLAAYAVSGGSAATLLFHSADGGTTWINAIASDGKDVYFAAGFGGGQQISRVSAAGGSVQQLAISHDPVEGIAVDSSSVYWTEAGSVIEVPLTGGTPQTLATNQQSAGPIVVDSTGVYWLERGALLGCPVLSGAGGWFHGALDHLSPGSTSPTTIASGIDGAVSLARGGGAVYWTDWSASCNYLAYGGSVMKQADGSSTAQAVSSNLATPDDLFVDSTTLYFMSWASNMVDIAGQGVPR